MNYDTWKTDVDSSEYSREEHIVDLLESLEEAWTFMLEDFAAKNYGSVAMTADSIEQLRRALDDYGVSYNHPDVFVDWERYDEIMRHPRVSPYDLNSVEREAMQQMEFKF